MKSISINLYLLLLTIGMLMIFTGCNVPAPPTTTCNVSDLIAEINDANDHPDHNHIILPENCDFELSKALYEIPDTGLDFDLEYAGLPSITSPITITGNHSRLIRLDTLGMDDFRFFHVAKEGSLSLVDLSLENGSVQEIGGAILVTGGTLSANQCEFHNNSAAGTGGAIATYDEYRVEGPSTEVVIINSIFRNNTAGGGGAIHHRTGLLDIDFETLFESNQAIGSGGAILFWGDNLVIYNSTFRNNQANSRGGGIFASGGTTTIQGVLIENNIAQKGGGIHSNHGELIIRDSQIRYNQAEMSGGIDLRYPNASISDGTVIEGNIALENAGGVGLGEDSMLFIEDSMIINNQSGEEGGGIGPTGGPFYPVVTMNNSTISGNSAALLGGGVYSNSGEWEIHNSTISGNTADGGGGIYSGADLVVTNSTISGNQAGAGGGVLHTASTEANFAFVTVAENTAFNGGGLQVDSSVIIISQSIVARNSPQNCLGNFLPYYSNLDDDGSCSFSITDDPLLEPLADNGGPTYTHAIASFGPAAELVNPCVYNIQNIVHPINLDQRGVARPQGVACDLGAYEAELSLWQIPPLSGCIYTATKNSHCRESDFNQAPVVEILNQGDTAALVALNPENTYGKFSLQSGEQCWIALSLMTPEGDSEDCPVPEENPLQIPVEKDPEKKKCKPTMGEAACKNAGGTWVGGVTEAPHCSCP